jgi:hypothetical protein
MSTNFDLAKSNNINATMKRIQNEVNTEIKRQKTLKANRQKALNTEFQSILNENYTRPAPLAPATGQLMNTTGVIELGDNIKTNKNLKLAIRDAKLGNWSERQSELIKSRFNEKGNLKFPNNALHKIQYGYTPEQYHQLRTSKALGKTSKGPNNRKPSHFSYIDASITVKINILDDMLKMLYMKKNSDEFAEMSAIFKKNIYRMIEALGEKYNAKSRSDKVLEDLLDDVNNKKEKQKLTELYKSIIPQDQTILNNEIKSFTAIIEEKNPMFKSRKNTRKNRKTRKMNNRRSLTRKN